jgi:hypothetical protein
MEKGLKRLSLFILLVFLAVCSREKKTLPDQRFAEFYAEVAGAQRSAPDSAAAADSAMAVAERHGISKRDLMEFHQRMEKQPTRWVEVWERIVHELRE